MPYANLQSERAVLTRRRSVRESYARLRMRALMLHGGKCAHCGFNDTRALQLDHVHGGGRRDRKTSGDNGATMLRAALRRPQDFQVLCANCNWIKRFECNEANQFFVEV